MEKLTVKCLVFVGKPRKTCHYEITLVKRNIKSCIQKARGVCVSGRNDKGQLGLGHLDRVDKPTVVECLSGHNIIAAACGRNHSLFLTGQLAVGESEM